MGMSPESRDTGECQGCHTNQAYHKLGIVAPEQVSRLAPTKTQIVTLGLPEVLSDILFRDLRISLYVLNAVIH